jgi:hypothetical protein
MKSNSHWAKQFYYYFVTGVSVLFLGVSIYTLLISLLINFVFTDLKPGNETFVYELCIIEKAGGFENNQTIFSNGRQDFSAVESKLSDEELDECKDEQAKQSLIQSEAQLIESLVDSTIGIIITSTIIFIHFKRFK